jgi:hypothetical protein
MPTWKASSRPGAVQARRQLPVLLSCFMSRMKLLCTPSNIWLSCGSCLRMSSEPMKMFSRYIQLRWTCAT